MTKERLSKLQRHILKRCLELTFIPRDEARKFFNKEFGFRKEGKEVDGWQISRIDKKYLIKKSKSVRIYDFDKGWTDDYETKDYFILNPKYTATKSEEATISRTLKNLKDKGYIRQISKWGDYYLTDKGLQSVNKIETACKTINIKEYKQRVEQKLKEAKEQAKRGQEKMTPPTPEKRAKIQELQWELMTFQREFTIDAIISKCCSNCRQKIDSFAKECGRQKLEKLKKKIEAMA